MWLASKRLPVILMGSAEGLAEVPASSWSPGESLGFRLASLFVAVPAHQGRGYLSSTGFFSRLVVVNSGSMCWL